MRTLTFELVGTTPLLLHEIARHQEREKIASKGGMSLEEEAAEVMSRDENGNPAVPASWIWNALREGCAQVLETPIGRQQISFVKLRSQLSIADDPIPLRDIDGNTPEWTVFSSVQHLKPGSKKMIAVIAPKFTNWMLVIQLVVKDSTLTDELVKIIFNEAGRKGIGLFHPPKKNFGRFEVSL